MIAIFSLCLETMDHDIGVTCTKLTFANLKISIRKQWRRLGSAFAGKTIIFTNHNSIYNMRGGKNGKQSIFKYVNHSGHFPSPELKNGNVKRLHFNFQRIPFFTHYSIIFVFFPLWFSVLSAKKSVFNDGEKADATPDSRRQSVSQSIWVLVLECELFTICRNCWNSIFTTLRLMLMCLVSWP